jgi:hypothetical protein
MVAADFHDDGMLDIAQPIPLLKRDDSAWSKPRDF